MDRASWNFLNAGLLRVNQRRFFDNSKNQTSCCSRPWNTRHLADTDARANRSHENYVASRENSLRSQVVPVNEDSGNVEYKSDKCKANTLRVAEEEARDVSSFNTGLVRNDKQVIVALENELQVFVSKRNHSAVVNDDVGEKRICLLETIIHCLLVELQFTDSKASQHHERTRRGHN